MKILIIQTAFIGDVILATPVIEKLHAFYPEAEVDFLLRKGNESLLANNPHLRKIHILNKKKHKYINLLKTTGRVRSESYDYVINIHRFLSSGMITAFSKAKNKIGFNKNPLSFFYTHKVLHHIHDKDNPSHETERNLMLIRHITDPAITGPKLYPDENDFSKVALDSEYICIAPASIWYTKQFPEDKWIELINRLDQKFTVCLIGGTEDLPLCHSIQGRTTHEKIRVLAGALSFLESAALMKNARMNFVNDSAPLHLASAVNAPVTAIFCSTIPEFGFGPLSDQSHVMETEEKLDCRPCGLHGKKKCPEKHFKCAEISISRILSTAGL